MRNLTLSWTTSRGQDTYGYNICRLDDSRTGKRYKTCGGGYDMTGTVLGDWLEDVCQSELLKLKDNAHATYSKTEGYRVAHVVKKDTDLYGMTYYADEDRVSLDGACGVSSMLDIAKAIGLEVKSYGNRKGHTLGFMVYGARS